MEKVKAYIPLLIFIAIIYFGMKLIPPYFSKWQFEDFCETEARTDTYNSKPEADIRRDVFKNARENGLPIASEDRIKVFRGPTGLSITAQWSVHVDFIVHPVDLDFSVNTLNKDPVAK